MNNHKPKAQKVEESSARDVEVGGSVSGVVISGNGNVVKIEESRQGRNLAIFALFTIVIIAFLVFILLDKNTASPVSTPVPVDATLVSFTEAAVPVTATILLPAEITDAKNVSMVLVPAGKFLMGSDEFEDSEKPSHTVDMPAYYIDKYEATNKFYKDCVDAGWCIPPVKSSSATRPSYFGNPEFSDYPVGYINWNMAKSYCEWRGVRLPTEAEWEKAARGSGGSVYPWGNALNCDYANYQGCNKDTTKMGSYESGKSPYGVYDMAGNVWEWVNDWYDAKYYLTLEENIFNPQGPTEGDFRVLHGGAWYYINGPNVRSSLRGWESPDVWDLLFGVRCADTP